MAFAMRVSPTIASRVMESAKEVLVPYLSDVYIYTDHYKGMHRILFYLLMVKYN